MANSDKNILITPNTGSGNLPSIAFTGADNNPITITVLDNGTLSFSGSSGQLFSVSDSLTGTIFSVNDISGIPSIEVDDTGVVRLAEFSGNVLVGTNVDNGNKLQVAGGGISVGGTSIIDSSGTWVGPNSGLVGPTGPTGPQGATGPAGSPDTAAEVLTKIKTVDGSGSGLDADTVDGIQGASFLRSDASDTATGQYSFTKVDDHAIKVGTIRGTVVGSQTGEYIQLYNRVNIGSPAGWGSRSAPTYGLSVYGSAEIATDTGTLTRAGNLVWDAGNDGSGSGLDADLLDGQHASAFQPAGTYNTIIGTDSDINTSGSTIIDNIFVTDGVITSMGTRTLTLGDLGYTGETNATADQTASEILTAIKTVDGGGSGLDADTVDGIQADRIPFGQNATGTINTQPSQTLKSGFYDIYNNNTPTATWYSYVNIRHNNVSNNHGHQIAGSFYDNNLWNRNINNGSFGPWSKSWSSNNDGSGSGLDADLLDGLQLHTGTNNLANRVVRTDGNGYIQAGWINTTSGSTTGTNRIYASNDGYIRYVTPTTFRNNLGLWWTGNDGSGSGLDADLLDGQQGSYYAAASSLGNYLPLSGGTLTGNLLFSNSGTAKRGIQGTMGDNDQWFVGGAATGSNSGYMEIAVGDDGSSAGNYESIYVRQYLGTPLTGSIQRTLTLLDNNGNTSIPNTLTVPNVYINNSSTRIHEGTSNSIRLQTNNGYVDIGPMNAAYTHIQTDRSKFYFDKPIHADSQIYDYDGGGTSRPYWHAGNDGSGSGLDADLLDGQQGNTYLGKFGNSYYQASTWIQLTSTHGLYAPTVNDAHFYPNTAGSYGVWRINGTRTGYSGIYHTNGGGVVTGMYNSSGNGGEYATGAIGGWHYFYHRSNRCMGVGGGSTSSSYGLYEQGGGIYSTGNITAYSDRRVKENIRTIDNALDTVEQMRGVYYNRIDDEEKKTVIGFIAQEVNEIEGAKPLVTYAEDVDQYGVSYGNTTALLVEAVKELSQQVKELQQEIKELKNV